MHRVCGRTPVGTKRGCWIRRNWSYREFWGAWLGAGKPTLDPQQKQLSVLFVARPPLHPKFRRGHQGGPNNTNGVLQWGCEGRDPQGRETIGQTRPQEKPTLPHLNLGLLASQINRHETNLFWLLNLSSLWCFAMGSLSTWHTDAQMLGVFLLSCPATLGHF